MYVVGINKMIQKCYQFLNTPPPNKINIFRFYIKKKEEVDSDTLRERSVTLQQTHLNQLIEKTA